MATDQVARNKAAVQSFQEAMNSQDAEVISSTIDALVAPDAVIRTPVPSGATGAEALKVVFLTLHRGLPDLRVTVEDLIAEGDKGCQPELGHRHPSGRVPGPPADRQVRRL